LLEDTMKCLTVATIAAVIFAAASASSAFAQSGAPGSTPSKPNKVTAVPPPPPPPGGPDKLVTRTQPPGPHKPTGPVVIDDIAGHPNQTHADLPPGPGTYNCASQNACTWLAAKCDKAGGGMSQNPPDEPGGFPTQTCTIY
jgi:hypothetical protein